MFKSKISPIHVTKVVVTHDELGYYILIHEDQRCEIDIVTLRASVSITVNDVTHALLKISLTEQEATALEKNRLEIIDEWNTNFLFARFTPLVLVYVDIWKACIDMYLRYKQECSLYALWFSKFGKKNSTRIYDYSITNIACLAVLNSPIMENPTFKSNYMFNILQNM